MSDAAPPPVRGGPWGGFMDVVMCILPIIFLLVVTLKPNPLPTTKSLPLSAVLMWLVSLAYLSADAAQTCALAVKGILSAFTPITIVAGAIFLFQSMESSRCLDWMRMRLKELTGGHPVAEIMLIGWAFAYMIEGASGFGTPAALASPMLMGMGHPKYETVVCLLLLNTFATVFGAVGTPIWFGFGGAVDNDEATLLAIGWKSALVMGVAAFLLVPIVVSILVPRETVRKNLVFVMLSICSCSGVSIAISTFSYDFPTLIGGGVGVGITGALVYYKVGLAAVDPDGGRKSEVERPSRRASREMHKPSSFRRPSGARRGSSGNAVHPPLAGEGEVAEGGTHARPQVDDTADDGPSSAPMPDAAWAAEQRRLRAPERGSAVPEAEDVLETNLGYAVAAAAVEDEETAEDAANDPFNMVVQAETSAHHALGRMMPLWLTVMLLVLTRIEQIGLKGLFKDKTDVYPVAHWGTFGDIWLSRSGVIGLSNMLAAPAVGWSYELLYVPFVIPFVVAGAAPLLLYRDQLKVPPLDIARGVVGRMVNPSISLFGALALVQMLRGVSGDPGAPAYVIGVRVSDALSYGWLVLSSPIGTLGSFFSGSTTVSNLTFGDVQRVAAQRLGLDVSSMLALQAAGATMGNAVCLNNIIAASAVVGLDVSEGEVMKRTAPIVGLYYVLATCVLIPFLFGTA